MRGRRGSDSDSSVCVRGGGVVTVVCAWEEDSLGNEYFIHAPAFLE